MRFSWRSSARPASRKRSAGLSSNATVRAPARSRSTASNERNGIAEAGRFAIAPEFRGRGIGLEAAQQFQRLLLVDLGFHRIELQIYGFNERALAHAERCGYVREGVKRKAYEKHGEWQDAVLFSLLREELDD